MRALTSSGTPRSSPAAWVMPPITRTSTYSRMDGLMPLLHDVRHRLGHLRQRGEGGQDRGRRREPGLELDGHLGRDGQGALGADEQLGQVVAARALDELAAGPQHGAVGQHHLEPEHVMAGHPVADGAHAAGVGGHVAAERAALLAGRDRVDQAQRRQLAVELLERHARLHHGDLVLGVDLHGSASCGRRPAGCRRRRARPRPRARCRCPGPPPARRVRSPACRTSDTSSVEPGSTTASGTTGTVVSASSCV